MPRPSVKVVLIRRQKLISLKAIAGKMLRRIRITTWDCKIFNYEYSTLQVNVAGCPSITFAVSGVTTKVGDEKSSAISQSGRMLMDAVHITEPYTFSALQV